MLASLPAIPKIQGSAWGSPPVGGGGGWDPRAFLSDSELISIPDRTDRNFQPGEGEEASAKVGQEPRLQPGAAPRLQGWMLTPKKPHLHSQEARTALAGWKASSTVDRGYEDSSPQLHPCQGRTLDAVRTPGNSQPIKGIFFFKNHNKGLMKFRSCRQQPYASNMLGTVGA